MKRILSLLIMLFMVISLVIPINNIKQTENEVVEPISLSDTTYDFVIEEIPKMEKVNVEPIEVTINEMQSKMKTIESIDSEMEWYISYKEIIDEYKEIIDPPETIYDYFTEEELDLLFKVVQAEVGDEWDFIHKANVASVIFNRLYSDERDFKEQDTLLKVLNKDQFCTIKNGSYKTVEVSEITILACEYAFQIEDTTNGALFFDNNGTLNYEHINNDGAHNFYKIGDE